MAITAADVQNYLAANPGLSDAQIAAAMDEYGVPASVVAEATGLSTSEVQGRYEAAGGSGAATTKTSPGSKSSNLQDVQNALLSDKVTQDQYNLLSSYFGNTVLPQDKNQINDFVGRKSGFELANYIATRDAAQGGGDIEGQQQALQNLIQPFKGANVQTGLQEVPYQDSTTLERYILDPITGERKQARLVDESKNLYAIDYGMLGRSSTDPAKMGYLPQLVFQVDPETNQAIMVGGGATMEKASGAFFDGLKPLLPMALAALGVQYPGLGATVGETLGMAGSTAQAVGNAIVKGLISEATGGDFISGAGSSLLSTAGGEALNSATGGGSLGPMDYTSPDYIDMSQVPIGIDFTAPINYDILSGATFPSEGLKIDPSKLAELPASGTIGNVPVDYGSLLNYGSDLGLVLPTSPSISSMGGGQGLTFQTPDGTFSAAGLTPTGATPVLGDESSFINDPEVLGTPVIQPYSESNLPGVGDALKAANALYKALTPVQEQTGLGIRQAGQRPAGVDYSSLLALLQGQARTPNVASLLG